MKDTLPNIAARGLRLFSRAASLRAAEDLAGCLVKTSPARLFLAPALVASLGMLPAVRSTAQTFATLRSFAGASDGSEPTYALAQSGDVFFGVCGYGGGHGNGALFSINSDGSGFKALHEFSGTDINGANADGANPFYGVILSGGSLYGAAVNGGSAGDGTVYTISTNGTGFKVLHSFTGNADQGSPSEKLVLSGNTLYGATYLVGTFGTIFAVNTDGTGFRTLHTFGGLGDGLDPKLGFLVSSNTIYGSTVGIGTPLSYGTIFSMHTDGTGFKTLYSFQGGVDGSTPSAVILSGNTLYGAAYEAGANFTGTIFSLGLDGTGFKVLHTFAAQSGASLTNSEGANPVAALLLSGGVLYGAATAGGPFGNGTVYTLSTNGAGFATLHGFKALNGAGYNSDGATPYGGLILSENTIYGEAQYGGISGDGTLFSLALPLPPAPPELSASLSESMLVLTWPTNSTGFALQSATNLAPPVAWSTLGLAPAVVNGLNTVTNRVSEGPQFYRLSQ
jgi:uncharacterized repeat protein (TIGR03803 family)